MVLLPFYHVVNPPYPPPGLFHILLSILCAHVQALRLTHAPMYVEEEEEEEGRKETMLPFK
jgi:hypothetical protein